MPKVDITINRPIQDVWEFFLALENWPKWWGTKPEKVIPSWQEHAKLIFKSGEIDDITVFDALHEIQITSQFLENTYRFKSLTPNTTICEYEFQPRGGASFNDGGMGHKRTMDMKLQLFKNSIESVVVPGRKAKNAVRSTKSTIREERRKFIKSGRVPPAYIANYKTTETTQGMTGGIPNNNFTAINLFIIGGLFLIGLIVVVALLVKNDPPNSMQDWMTILLLVGLFGVIIGRGWFVALKFFRLKAKGMTFVALNKAPSGLIYELYKGKDAKSAKAFLGLKHIDKKDYYIRIETPEGIWGLDIDGLYLEGLVPFQLNIDFAQFDGTIIGAPTIANLQYASDRILDNFVTKVKCGNCKNEWDDGVQYNNITVVKCPECKSLSKINSRSYVVHSEKPEKLEKKPVKRAVIKETFGIVICPNCGNRVLPKPDGTCPSCQSMIQGSEFMADLTQEEKVTVSNLSPTLYAVIIGEKSSGKKANIITEEMVVQHSIPLLRKLAVADLEKLSQAVELCIKADRAVDQGNFEEAIRLYKKTIEINPHHDIALMSYGVGLAEFGSLREGIKWVEKAIKVNPKNSRARMNLQAMKARL